MRSVINFSGSGDNIIVPAVMGLRIFVWRMKYLVGGATNITVKDTNGNVLDGPFNFGANQGVILDFSVEPWYQTDFGAGLVLNSSMAVQVGGLVEYGQP